MHMKPRDGLAVFSYVMPALPTRPFYYPTSFGKTHALMGIECTTGLKLVTFFF